MPVENLSNFLLWRGALLGEAVKLAFKTPGAIVEHLDDQLVLAGKVANIVILATSASAMIRSIPVAWKPARLNNA